MSQIFKGIFGALAVSATFGAVQFASGHDLIGRQAVTPAPETGINRAAKVDRGAMLPAPGPSETIALRLDSLADTSILIRVPVVRDEARGRALPPPEVTKSGGRRMTIACEPVVSVLTEVAKRLQPGRCIA
jgi:hypothetical protein